MKISRFAPGPLGMVLSNKKGGVLPSPGVEKKEFNIFMPKKTKNKKKTTNKQINKKPLKSGHYFESSRVIIFFKKPTGSIVQWLRHRSTKLEILSPESRTGLFCPSSLVPFYPSIISSVNTFFFPSQFLILFFFFSLIFPLYLG